MHEKYSCEVAGGVGGGGEYTPQVGFGWTNGVALDLLRRYRHTITLE
jgi:alpha,alpha-trehalase